MHPDHRGEETLNLITNGNFGSITHQGRVFVALSVFFRYAGLSEQNEPPEIMPEPLGRAWIGKTMTRGAWYYSAEEDVGYCAAIRTHATILARDPVFGDIAYGGLVARKGQTSEVIPRDGLRVRFHVMRGDQRLHLALDHDGYAKEQPIVVADDLSRVQFTLENRSGGAHTTGLSLAGLPAGEYEVTVDGKRAASVQGAKDTTVSLPVGPAATSAVAIRRR